MRRVAILALVALAAVSCGSSTSHVASAISPTPSQLATPSGASTPSILASPPAPSPAAPPGLTSPQPLPPSGLSCRLPVLFTPNGSRVEWDGGFFNFPSATYTPDPNGVIKQNSAGTLVTSGQPSLGGLGDEAFYDLATKSWIPAAPDQTAPDGQTYAYYQVDPRPEENLVVITTVATGQIQIATHNPPLFFPDAVIIESFDGRWAYLSDPILSGHEGSAVWRFDTEWGGLVELTKASGILLVRDGYAWVGLINPADPAPPKPTDGTPGIDSIAQIDLATGVETTWIYRPGENVALLGLDLNGRPVVSVAQGPSFDPSHATVLLLSAPGDSGTLISSGGIDVLRMQRDIGRLWFGTDQGIYLWTAAGGLRKVISSTQPLVPAGFCV